MHICKSYCGKSVAPFYVNTMYIQSGPTLYVYVLIWDTVWPLIADVTLYCDRATLEHSCCGDWLAASSSSNLLTVQSTKRDWSTTYAPPLAIYLSPQFGQPSHDCIIGQAGVRRSAVSVDTRAARPGTASYATVGPLVVECLLANVLTSSLRAINY